MKRLGFIFFVWANAAFAQDALPTIESVLDDVSGKNISATGYIGKPEGLDWIYFVMKDGRKFRTELAVDRATLEAIEACRLGYQVPSGCAADITGAIRLKDDYFEVLVDSIPSLRPVE